MAILAVRLLTTYIMKHLRNTNVEPIEALSMIKYVFKEDDIQSMVDNDCCSIDRTTDIIRNHS